MNQQEIQGVARQIERLTKRVIRAELGNQLEREALVEIAKLLEFPSNGWKLSDLVADVKADKAIESQYSETRKILGVRDGETTSDAAKRVVAERDEQRIEIEAWRADLGRWREMIGSLPEESLEEAMKRVMFVKTALEAERDDLRRVFSLVHGSLGIQQGEHIGNAIDALKKERDELATRLRQSIARGDFAEMRAATLLAELAEQKPACDPPPEAKPEPDLTALHATRWLPGDVVRLINTPPEWEAEWGQIGDIGTVKSVSEYDTGVRIRETGMQWPGDGIELVTRKRTEATHITPEGLRAAEGAVEPKPGDVVRLVRIPTQNEYPHDSGRWEPNWGWIGDYMRVHYVGSNINRTRVVRAVFGLEWPLSCVEVVKGGDK